MNGVEHSRQMIRIYDSVNVIIICFTLVPQYFPYFRRVYCPSLHYVWFVLNSSDQKTNYTVVYLFSVNKVRK
jgi:hypothetical protein